MTTAARPTFDTRRGVSIQDAGLTSQISSRDMTGYTKLKWRQFVVTNAETDKKKQKWELEQKEQEHFKKGKQQQQQQDTKQAAALTNLSDTSNLLLPSTTTTTYDRQGETNEFSELDFDPRALLKRPMTMMKPHVSLEDEDRNADDDDVDDDDDDDRSPLDEEEGEDRNSNDSDTEDETVELMRELERIKRERAEEKSRNEQLQRETLEQRKTEAALHGNPLLDPDRTNFTVKRRWDDDVVFKHQTRGVDEKAQKRFINDTLRSDFHRKFMERYIH
jgi:protein CWC15